MICELFSVQLVYRIFEQTNEWNFYIITSKTNIISKNLKLVYFKYKLK